jgi:hypothetical protein
LSNRLSGLGNEFLAFLYRDNGLGRLKYFMASFPKIGLIWTCISIADTVRDEVRVGPLHGGIAQAIPKDLESIVDFLLVFRCDAL